MDDWANLLATERHARIRAVLDAYRGDEGLYIDPEIPPNKLANLRAASRMPASERALGLLDCTVFGSAKNGVVFGESALYYHNSWTTSNEAHRGPRRLPYDELARLELTKGWMEVRFPGGAIEVSGSSFSTDKALGMLAELQRVVTHGVSYGTRSPLDGTAIPPYLVDRGCLEPSNERWPSGIGTHADASIVRPPFERVWGLELGPVVEAPAIVRDFVILAIHGGVLTRTPSQLIGLELTTGRRYWQRELPLVHWGALVATSGLVFRRGGALWHAFDIETGEPRPIEVPALPRPVRDQLVLADATISAPASYAAFPDELAPPVAIAGSPPLIAANHRRRVYAWQGETARAPSIRIVDARGSFDLAGRDRGELASHAMTERYLFLGTRDRVLHIVDCEASPPAFVATEVLPEVADRISIGSDHLVIASAQWVRCYRGS